MYFLQGSYMIRFGKITLTTLCRGWIGRKQEWTQEGRLGDFMMVQVRGDDGLDQNDSNGREITDM